jgi:hypothetical protein
MDEDTYGAVKVYLRQLGWALDSLPERDRDDIVEETRLHMLARLEAGRSLESLIAELGPADRYARSFIDQMEASSALASQQPFKSWAVVARRAHRSIVAATVLAATAGLLVLGLIGAVPLVLKPFDPTHVGLWVMDSGGFVIGKARGGPGDHELLGAWIYPLAVLDLLAVWLIGRRLVLWAVARLAR